MRSFLLAVLMLLAAPAWSHGAVVIGEVVPNPALPEPAAEFVVLENTGGSTVRLDGMRLTDSTGAVRGVVAPDTSLDPGQRIALQPAGGASVYGCAGNPYRALLTAWPPLNNDGDTVVLEAPDGRVLDRVTYARDAYATDSNATPCGIAPPRPGTLALAALAFEAREGDGSVVVGLRRSGGSNGRVGVRAATRDASALGGFDYERVDAAVSLGATQTSATLRVPLRGDGRDEPDESFTVVLASPTGGASVAEPARATIVVRDDDPPAPPAATPVSQTRPASPAAPPATVFNPAPLPPAPAPAPAIVAPARATLAVAPWQPVGRRRAVAVAVGCDRDCSVTLSGRIALGRGRLVRLAPTTRSLSGHAHATILVRVPSRVVRPLRRALRRRGSLTARIAATPAGGQPVERRARIR